MLVVFKYFMIFSLGTILGWAIEVFWRRFLGLAKRWINPGFLSGPWLPIYGFGSILLYIISLTELPLYILAPVFLIVLTVIEYIAGLIFTGVFKIKLWDYSDSPGNIRGLICPLYSILWMGLGLFFYLVIYPKLNMFAGLLYNRPEFSFFIGIYGGLFSVDIWQSFSLAARIRTFVRETEERLSIDYERFKLELRDRIHEGGVNRTHFLLPFHGELGASFRQQLKEHLKSPLKFRKRKKDNS